MENIFEIKNLNVSFSSFGETVSIVRDFSLAIGKGEIVGIVGESGCGKSMTALAVMRLIKSPPGIISGRVQLDGTNLLDLSEAEMRAVRGNKISMIFQEPMTSLNPVFTVGEQLMEVFRFHQGMNKKEAREKSIEMLRMVNIALPEQRIDEYPHQLSGGMRQRVMIAMALSCNPMLLIADEPTTALDVTIQAQILTLMKKLGREFGTSIMLITHDLGVVSEVCSRAVIVYCGQIVEEASSEELFSRPLHPYTKGLLDSLPHPGRGEKLHVIPGTVPSPKNFPQGCVFNPRCGHATQRCVECLPELAEISPGHKVKCWLYDRGPNKNG
ncbi:ABC transporter ATP-binding protein [Cloacibacillus evryensis]|uniref:ABC transporter ATP-binding protein n=2 Tax=Cloacibacillus TaxID=508459 RepID=A0AAW5K9N8_9BACT|nr:ABC transporter ATP-binding protein [Cloacibacillus evryensis]EHL64422.1 oligopeptide/dipeptide ABC transporter, ATP-binding protein domain [Synergistes sp. 3_1_syn1]MCQ4764746.1 ABC transporter ATP-binding protein [Cloacibacillus evryensis]MCQ4814739.1 ABC transporter ATP-binding protein [Cloacibacillus evryensis]